VSGVHADGPAEDPVIVPPVMVHLFLYKISVPFGQVSASDAFWKHVNEHAVNVATYDLLYKNGIRVGVAPVSEWQSLRKIIDLAPARYTLANLGGVNAVDEDVEMSDAIDSEDVFYFDENNFLTGRTFERCRNFLGVSFMPSPRDAQRVRVSLCPIIRSERTVWHFTVLNDVQEAKQIRPEHLFDVNLSAEIGPDEVLIVSPSTEGHWDTSLGNRFLVSEGATEKMETVLLLVARPVELDVASAPAAVTPLNPVAPPEGLKASPTAGGLRPGEE
jgi:hypothetical protein